MRYANVKIALGLRSCESPAMSSDSENACATNKHCSTSNRFPFRNKTSGFTITELLLIILVVFLLIFVLLPSSHQAHGRQLCVKQLKEVGLAFRMFANESGPYFPMAIQTNAHGYGTKEFIETGEVFRHFVALTNALLRSPAILVCPADKQRTRTTDWAKFNNQNLSYFVGPDAHEICPQMLLSGDRNITGGILTNEHLLFFSTNTPAGWGRQLHKNFGNVACADGSVKTLTEQQLRLQVQADLASSPYPPRTQPGVVRLAIP